MGPSKHTTTLAFSFRSAPKTEPKGIQRLFIGLKRITHSIQITDEQNRLLYLSRLGGFKGININSPCSGRAHLLAKKRATAVWPFEGIEVVVAGHGITHLLSCSKTQPEQSNRDYD